MTIKTRVNPYGVLLFFVLFFSLIVIGHSFIVPAIFKPDNMVSVFYVRKDNIANTFQAEIYPVAIHTHSKYIDAATEVNDSVNKKPQTESYLARIRDFAVIEKGRILGMFHVSEISPSPFMCSSIMTGKGTLKDGNSLSSVFDQMSEARSSHSKGFEGKKEFDYELKWSLAESQINKVSGTAMVITESDTKRYMADLMNTGSSLLAKYVSDEGNEAESSIVLDKLSAFDLDHDGKPEVSAKLKKVIRKKIKVTQGTEEKEEYSNETVYLNLLVTYKNGNPQVILSLISYEREGSWGSGADLIGTADINGDGVEEVILRSSGWEVVEFEIYEYHNDILTRVFRGAGFGC